MTDQAQHPKSPSQPQIELLMDLAEETGRSFAWPKTSGEARVQISSLLRQKKTMRIDRRRERQEVTRSLAEESGDAAAVRDDELVGYGSTARWAGSRG
jgi:hypothetical protein